MLLKPGPPKVLRQDQERILAAIIDNLVPPDLSVLSASPTGSGKTVILSEIARRTMARGNRTAVLTDRQEILEQIATAVYSQTGVPPGIVWKENSGWYEDVVVIAQSTFHARELPPDAPPFHVLMIDEAHHASAPTWIHSVARLDPQVLIGFTATPFRHDKEPLTPRPFSKAIRPVTPKELIEAKLLVPPVIESLVTYGEDRLPKPIGHARNLPALYLATVNYAISQGRTKIVLYVSRTADHTPTQVMEQTVALLERSGIVAAAVHKDQSVSARRRAIRRFTSAPAASVLVNYITVTEGTDIPFIDCIIIGRETRSESTIIQMIGRGLRVHETKIDCLVIEYTNRKDMEDIIHYWRLDGEKEKGAGGTKQPTRLDKDQMAELSVQFKQTISPLGASQVDFPWFRPYADKSLLALSLHSHDTAGAYVTAEPRPDGTWRVTQLTLNTSGPSPVTKRQTGSLQPDEAVRAVQAIIGNQAPSLKRTAPWRSRLATEAQRNTAYRLIETQAEDAATAGELSDLIARERFLRRVPASAL